MMRPHILITPPVKQYPRNAIITAIVYHSNPLINMVALLSYSRSLLIIVGVEISVTLPPFRRFIVAFVE